MAISPMMQQYLNTKEQYKDCLLFYRLGDFYELFYEDAIIASRVLDLTLTGRNCGVEDKAPMCGVPYHAAETYISRLLSEGYKVAICEQLTEPTKGKIVVRDVTRVVTPGTIMDSSLLEDKKNNYIVSISQNNNSIGVAYADITTGEFCVCEYQENAYIKTNDCLNRLSPKEIIVNEQMYANSYHLPTYKAGQLPKFSKYYEWTYDLSTAIDTITKQLNVSTISRYDYAQKTSAISAAGALINYLIETQKRSLSHINKIKLIKDNDYMYLDNISIKNLELVQTNREQKKKGSLLWVLDYTKTSMGARQLYNWLLQPLQNSNAINTRLDCVEELFNHPQYLDDIISALSNIRDIQRIAGKISYGNVMPKDLISLKESLNFVPELKKTLNLINNAHLNNLLLNSEDCKALSKFLDNAIAPDCPALLSAGGYIKNGFNKELDELRDTSNSAKIWLANLEAKEKEETGIKNLKIGYTRVFGYYIEVNKSQENLVPFRYQRKQTIANHERFITPELKEIEDKILNSEELAQKLESDLYNKIKEYLLSIVSTLQSTANDIATIDCYSSLATCAIKNNYSRPLINNEITSINIVDGRHPVVEVVTGKENFVPNDTNLTESNNTMIITGPNMAGKSTYMRQVALITLLAHIGSFVPAKSAEICICDRIFTRIGASDDLAYGQSTFMVEMVEVSNIINNATNKSLLILDEVGRGTSTYDGLSIAWAVIEYIVNNIKAKTLFATHYHELTQLEGKLDGVKNYRISVKEFNNSIIFLRKIVRGGANKSFGIEVASLAGIYDDIIKRAKVILSDIEKTGINLTNDVVENKPVASNNNIEIINILKELNIETLSPLVAFEILSDLIQKAKKEL